MQYLPFSGSLVKSQNFKNILTKLLACLQNKTLHIFGSIKNQKGLVDMVFKLGKCQKNCLLASCVYAQHNCNQNRFRKKKKLWELTLRIYCYWQCLVGQKSKQDRYITAIQVSRSKALQREMVYISIWEISNAANIWFKLVNRILHRHAYQQYKIQKHLRLLS